MGISVVICCYNSEARLPETLKHLAMQQVPADISWELIIVNNASTDGTAKAAGKLWERFDVAGCNMTMLEEPRPGKNFAFEKGVRAARYDFILTCDDDNWLAPDYIARACAIMKSDEQIGALGGCGMFEPEAPMNPEISAFTDHFVNGPQTEVETNPWVYGAGSIYRKDAILNLLDNGWRQITTGRKGKSLICGEDVEICLMLYLTGYKIRASNELLFRHFVPHKRQTLAYLLNLEMWLNYSNVLLINYHLQRAHDSRPIAPIINGWLMNITRSLVKQILLLPLRRSKKDKDVRLKSKFAFNRLYGQFRALVENRSRLIRHHKHLADLLKNYQKTELSSE
jgi:glycosyltransferase involved in cell wall biosynthesis